MWLWVAALRSGQWPRSAAATRHGSKEEPCGWASNRLLTISVRSRRTPAACCSLVLAAAVPCTQSAQCHESTAIHVLYWNPRTRLLLTPPQRSDSTAPRIRYKLIVANCGGRGLTGTGGGWIVPATNASKAYPNQGTKSSADPVDDFLRIGCNKSAPCLYHVGGGDTPYASDAAERVNLAAEQPHLVQSMLARLAKYEATAWNGEVTAVDTWMACDRALANGGVLGPWQ